MIVLAIIIGAVYFVTYNIKYGLSDEEKVQYDIAQSNDNKIKSYVKELKYEFFNIASDYMEINDNSYERKDRMSEAEKDVDFLYSRGLYMTAPMLYDLVEDQYPEKYRSIYVQLVKMRKGEIYTDILANETRYIRHSSASDLADKQDEINEAIEIAEKYMNKDVLNPAKFKVPNVDIPNPDYSKVYGINLGILFYEDGNIRYIGEISDGKANGFGKCWYSENDGEVSWAEGIFEDGIFKVGDKCFDVQGNKVSASEVSDIVIAGDFEIVQGVNNATSSKSVVEQNKNNEEQDKLKAQAAVENYINDVLAKQSSITNITWITIPDISTDGEYYFFSCTVNYGDLEREGTITVEKNDGILKATGLEFKD